jgi:cytochrome c6
MKFNLIVLLISLATIAFAQTNPPSDAQKLYKSNCARCHGKNGDKGLFRAPKLSQSKLNDNFVLLLLQEGKGKMPSFRKSLTDQEMQDLLAYIKLFRS